MESLLFKRFGWRAGIVNAFRVYDRSGFVRAASPYLLDSNSGSLQPFSVLVLERRGTNAGIFSQPFGVSARGLQEQALVISDAPEPPVFKDPDLQAAASALQKHLQKHSEAYLTDAVAVVERCPLFLKKLVDLTRQKSLETVEEEAESKIKRKKKGKAASTIFKELDSEKQLEEILNSTGINILEPIFESIGVTSERFKGVVQKLSSEVVDVRSLLFVVRWIQKLGIPRNKLGDMINKDVGVLSLKSAEIDEGFHTLRTLSTSEDQVFRLILRCPLVLKSEVTSNIAALAIELQPLPSKNVIMWKALCKDASRIHNYSKGCAAAVLHFLRRYDLTDERLDILLQRHIGLLFLDMENQLKCSVKFLMDVGLTRQMIVKVLSRAPCVLLDSLEDNLTRLEYFTSLGFSKPEFAHIISKYPNLLHANLEGKIKPVIRELQTLGLSNDKVKKIVFYRPNLFGYKLDGEMHALIQSLKDSSYNEGQKVTAFIKLYSRGLDQRKKCEDCLIKHGLAVSEAKQVVDKAPRILGYDEKLISERMDHLTQTLGLPIQNVVTVPEYLTVGFKRRVLRRQRVLSYMKSKGLLTESLTLKELVSPSNIKFFNTFVKPHSEDKEISNIWLKHREGMGTVDGLNFLRSFSEGRSEAQVSS